MSTRFKMGKLYPEAYKTLNELDNIISTSSIDNWHQQLIRIRASQINGCAFCTDMHTQDALKLGINPRKLHVIVTWREALNHFSEEEQLVLRMTEEITLISQHGLSDLVYDKAIKLFGEPLTAQIIMAIITINAWNRIGVGLKLEPAF